MYGHTAVLLSQVLAYLNPMPGGVFIDATFGAGGHTRALLEGTSPTGRVLALDVDQSALDAGRQVLSDFGDRLVLRNANFRDVAEAAAQAGFAQVDGVLADIGVSSMMLDDPS